MGFEELIWNTYLLLFSEPRAQIGPLSQFPPGQGTEVSRYTNDSAPQRGGAVEDCRSCYIPQNTAAPRIAAVLYHRESGRGISVFGRLCVSISLE